MAKHTRVLVAALIAAATLTATVSTANARRFAASENHFLSHFRELTFEAGGVSVICPVSMEGSFHSRTFEKVARSLIGYISEVRVARPCRGGEAWALTAQEGRPETLPWHILYERFIEPLPRIAGIELTLDNGGFLTGISVLGVPVSCLYQATTTSPQKGIVNREAGGRATGLRVNETAGIPKHEGPGACPNPGFLKGTGIVGTQVGYTPITLTLVA